MMMTMTITDSITFHCRRQSLRQNVLLLSPSSAKRAGQRVLDPSTKCPRSATSAASCWRPPARRPAFASGPQTRHARTRRARLSSFLRHPSVRAGFRGHTFGARRLSGRLQALWDRVAGLGMVLDATPSRGYWSIPATARAGGHPPVGIMLLRPTPRPSWGVRVSRRDDESCSNTGCDAQRIKD